MPPDKLKTKKTKPMAMEMAMATFIGTFFCVKKICAEPYYDVDGEQSVDGEQAWTENKRGRRTSVVTAIPTIP